MRGRSRLHKSRKVMAQVQTSAGHRNQFQANILCHYYFQYIAFFGKDNFGAKPKFFDQPHNVLTF